MRKRVNQETKLPQSYPANVRQGNNGERKRWWEQVTSDYGERCGENLILYPQRQQGIGHG